MGSREKDKDKNDDKTYFQVDRFYQSNGEWYFTTREGYEKGPFSDKAEAERELADYLRHKKKMIDFE